MKLLVACQAVDADSPTLGFFIEWLKEFSRHCEEVRVFGFEVGRYDLPGNVRVTSGGKENGTPRLLRILRYWKFLREWLPGADGLFAHLSPEYAVLAWPFAAASKTSIVLWYAHRAVGLPLRLAALVCRRIVSISPGSCRLRTPKLRFLGHGIPTELFIPASGYRAQGSGTKLLSVGRITPIKRIELMIDAVGRLRGRGLPATLSLVGSPMTEADIGYRRGLERMIEAKRLSAAVTFNGGMPYARLPEVYRSHALHLNTCPTGAPDKAVFEAMASGLPVVVTNRTFGPIFGTDAGRLTADEDDADIAAKVEALLRRPDPDLPRRLRAIVEAHHSLDHLIRGIIGQYDLA